MIHAPVSSEALTAFTALRKHYPRGPARRNVPGPEDHTLHCCQLRASCADNTSPHEQEKKLTCIVTQFSMFAVYFVRGKTELHLIFFLSGDSFPPLIFTRE